MVTFHFEVVLLLDRGRCKTMTMQITIQGCLLIKNFLTNHLFLLFHFPTDLAFLIIPSFHLSYVRTDSVFLISSL